MKKLALLLSVFAIAMFTACGEQADEATQAPTEDTDEVALAEITITNGLEAWDIHSILVDQSDEPWSEDLLEEGEIIAPGISYTLEVEEGAWDIMVTDEDGDTYTLWQVEIGAEGYQWNVTLDDMDSGWEEEELTEPQVIETGEGIAPITITNDLQGWNIFWVYVDPAGEPWGDDLMGMDVLYQDDQLIVWVNPGTYDIKVEDEDGDTYTLWEVEVDEAGYEWDVTLDYMDSAIEEEITNAQVLETGEGTSPITISNDLGGWDIYFVYVDPSDSPWGEDRLGAEILEGSSQITVWVNPGSYDMKVEDEDGDTYTLWGINVDENGYKWAVTLDDMD